MQVNPHHVADAAAAVAITWNYQTQRVPRNRLAVPTIDQHHLLALKFGTEPRDFLMDITIFAESGARRKKRITEARRVPRRDRYRGGRALG